MSYSAVICRISTRPHGNATKLQLGTAQGNQVVLGLDTPDGSLGIFFPTDGQLSDAYCQANNLYTTSAQAKLGLTPAPVGYLSEKRRVRSQRFRGERSDGLWLPLDSLQWTGVDVSTLKEGDSLTELNGQQVCQKYYTPATLKAMKGGTPRTRKENLCFPKHADTKQFRFFADSIPEDAVLWISEKLHGTSQRVGFVLCDTELPRWKSLINKIYRVFPEQEYRFLVGSKNVIINQ